MRPAKQFQINALLEKTGGKAVEDFTSPYEVDSALQFLRSLDDHTVISEAVSDLESALGPKLVAKEATPNAVPHFTETKEEGKVNEEEPTLTSEGLERLEATFGTGGRKRRGLVYGGLTLNQFVGSQED